jgi:hypothetical protein
LKQLSPGSSDNIRLLSKVGTFKITKVKRETSEEMDLLDTMLSSVVKLLEEKGTIAKRNIKVE